MVIISVVEHKTSQEGHAKLLLSIDDYKWLQQYLKCVRPLQDPNRTEPYIIVMCRPKQMNRMTRLIKSLKLKYALVLPTATRVRKIGSTTVARNVGASAESSMITHQLSHTAKTDELQYQEIVGDIHSAQAFRSMEAL